MSIAIVLMYNESIFVDWKSNFSTTVSNGFQQIDADARQLKKVDNHQALMKNLHDMWLDCQDRAYVRTVMIGADVLEHYGSRY